MHSNLRQWADAASRSLPEGDTRNIFMGLVSLMDEGGLVEFRNLAALADRIGARRPISYTIRYLSSRKLVVRQGRRRLCAAPYAKPLAITNERDAKIIGEQRDRILARDGNACRACGGVKRLCIDHIVAWSSGGTNEDSNLQVLCGSCNSRKQDRTQEHFEELCRKAGVALRCAA